MIQGFQKIVLSDNKIKSNSKQNTVSTHKILKSIGIIFSILILFIIISSVAIYIPGRDLYLSVQKSILVAGDAYDAAKKQDIDTAKDRFKDLETDLHIVESNLGKLSWTKYIPFLGSYYTDAEHTIKASINGIQAVIITTETLSPYADLLGLKGKSTFVAGTADERIRTAVDTLDKIIPNIDAIADKITVVGDELNKIDENRYPEKIGKYLVRRKIIDAKNLFSETANLFLEAKPLLKKIPELLGNKESKRYLALFQNDAELRATGGFISAYSVFKVDKGKIQVEKGDDIYKLDASKNKKYPAPSPILKYHKDVNYLELRDSNLSPDYQISMQEFEKMINESVIGFPKFDGIIALDTHVFVSAIKILGDFNIYGRNFTAELDPRCDCPKAIYELEDYSTKPVAYVREDRKDIIGVLMYQIMQRAFGVSPSKYWGRLFQMFLDEAKQKHVLFYFHDADAQKGIESLDFGGKILPYDGDYLHVNDVNFAGAKSNIFVKHIIKQDINIERDGSIIKTLTLTYKNPSPPSNCNLEAGQLCLNGILRNWLRVYVPKGSSLISFTGSEKENVSYEDLGKTVFEGFFTVKPQGSTEAIIKYKLPFKYTDEKYYKLFIQKQPGTEGYEYNVLKNGKEIEKFILSTDKELELRM